MGGLQYAVLFACIVTACAFWQTRVNVRNPENNPLLNDPNLGPLQNATECLEKQTDDPYVLMFRAKNFEPNITCVSVRANISDASSKIYNFTRQYRNNTETITVQYQVRALKSSGYDVENVIRASLNAGQDPPDTPTPPGSMMYVQYADYDCNASSSPFLDAVKKELVANTEPQSTSEDTENGQTEPKQEADAYLDFYVVYEQSNCSVLRAPSLQGACDFWVEKSVAEQAMLTAKKATEKPTEATNEGEGQQNTQQDSSLSQRDAGNNEQGVGTDIQSKKVTDDELAKVVFKNLPDACRYAFLVACRPPYTMMYDKETCDKQTTVAANSEQSRR